MKKLLTISPNPFHLYKASIKKVKIHYLAVACRSFVTIYTINAALLGPATVHTSHILLLNRCY